MILRSVIAASALALSACSTTPPATESDSSLAMPAQLVPSAPRPLEIVEIPKPIPFPGQLKPPPQLNAPITAVSPQESVKDANAAARIEPNPAGFIDAVQVWPYSPGALYQLYTTPGKVTDIALEPGEDIIDISTPDSVRWIVGDSRSGTGAEERRHVIVKPTRPELQTNLVILTSRRTYHLEVRSTSETWMAAVSWDYPQTRLAQLKAANEKAEAEVPIPFGFNLDNVNFRYDITGDKPSWRPLRAFDNGSQVVIQFPDTIQQDELPPLFIIGPHNTSQLVNYRARGRYYLVDQLFMGAELRLGGKDAQVVRIERNDPPKARRSRRAGR